MLRLLLHFHGGLEIEKTERDLSGAVLLPGSQQRLAVALKRLAAGQLALHVELDVTSDEVVIKSRPLRNAIPVNGLGFEWRFTRRQARAAGEGLHARTRCCRAR